MRSPFHGHQVPVIALCTVISAAIVFFVQGMNEKRQTAKAHAREAVVKSSRDQQLQQFKLTGFDERGQKFWDLEGKAAKIDPSQTIYLDENVKFKLRDGMVVHTSRVQWSQAAGVFRTDAPVTVNRAETVIRGKGAVGRPSESFLQLNRDIQMTINASTHLTCEGPMKVFYKENKMVFFRKVRVKDSRGVLTANRMDVFFGGEDKKVDKIIAIGNVVIERGSDTTRSQRAVYSLLTGSVRLEGNPEITLHKGGSSLLDAAP
ncbi:MAG: LPS export ABC transporter periplasmic protein LptC [Candidatus Omnitrophica bacterium]|nr:LPS export ABC transporter periplasmic protein LptC [Candidatus Omnitrophota bacterium]